MSQSRKQQALFPDLPRQYKIVDEKGYLSSEWRMFFDQLITSLQTNYKPEGIAIPIKTSAEIAQLNQLTPNVPESVQSTIYKSRGNIVYNSDDNHFYGNLNSATWTLII